MNITPVTFVEMKKKKEHNKIVNTYKMPKYLKLLVVTLLITYSISTRAQLDFSPLDKKLITYKQELGLTYSCLIEKDGKILFKKESPDFDIKTSGTLGQ